MAVTPSLETILGIERSEPGLIGAVRTGLPVNSFAAVAEYTQLTRERLAKAARIPLRNVQRRTARLKPDESDRLARVARVYALAQSVLNSRTAAERWMDTPNRSLDGERPLDMLDSEVASREVEDALGRIDDGVFG